MKTTRNAYTLSVDQSADLLKISKPYRAPTLAKKQVLSAVTAESPPLSRTIPLDGGVASDGAV